MDKIISDNSGYKVLAGVNPLGSGGLYQLKFSTQYDSAKSPCGLHTKFEAYLTWSQLQEFRKLLESV